MSDNIVQEIAQDIAAGNPVATNDVKFLLWIALCQLQSLGQHHLLDLDEERCYVIDSMLDQLDLDLGLLPGGNNDEF